MPACEPGGDALYNELFYTLQPYTWFMVMVRKDEGGTWKPQPLPLHLASRMERQHWTLQDCHWRDGEE